MNEIRTASHNDLDTICRLHLAAFGDEGTEIERLIRALETDATAEPRLSLVAEDGGQIVGHILFTTVHVEKAPAEQHAAILSPMGVLPERQGAGIGGALIGEGLNRLRASGTEVVFVLGHPEYYPRFGFEPAGAHGFETPRPIPAEHANAWMVQPLVEGAVDRCSGRVLCADSLMQPEYW